MGMQQPNMMQMKGGMQQMGMQPQRAGGNNPFTMGMGMGGMPNMNQMQMQGGVPGQFPGGPNQFSGQNPNMMRGGMPGMPQQGMPGGGMGDGRGQQGVGSGPNAVPMPAKAPAR